MKNPNLTQNACQMDFECSRLVSTVYFPPSGPNLFWVEEIEVEAYATTVEMAVGVRVLPLPDDGQSISRDAGGTVWPVFPSLLPGAPSPCSARVGPSRPGREPFLVLVRSSPWRFCQ